MVGDKIVTVSLAQGGSQFLQHLNIGFGQEPSAVGGNAQHELSAPSDRLLVGGNQFGQAFEAGFVVGMPEPVPFAQRRVGFDRTPAKESVAVDDVPVLVRNDRSEEHTSELQS